MAKSKGRRLATLRASAGLVALAWAATTEASAAAFAQGNLVIYRVGDGANSLVNTGSPVFLDEYTPSGSLVQSIALPTITSGANRRLIASGTTTSEGLLTRSSDSRFLFFTGYDAALGTSGLTSTTAAAVPRVVGKVGVDGVIATTTGLTDAASGNSPRSVVSFDGNIFWMTGGAGGLRYATVGNTTSGLVSIASASLRQVNIFGGQLYVSLSNGAVPVQLGAVGVGLPTFPSLISSLPGIPTSGNSFYGFFFADLAPSVPGVDTLYVGDETLDRLHKFSLSAGVWNARGTVVCTDCRGLTGIVINANEVRLYATSAGGSGATGGGALVSFFDITGYDATVSGSVSLLATAATNMAFRGLALTPTAPPVAVPAISQGGAALLGSVLAVLTVLLFRHQARSLR